MLLRNTGFCIGPTISLLAQTLLLWVSRTRHQGAVEARRRRRHLILLRARPLKRVFPNQKSPTRINRTWRRSRWRRRPRQRRRRRRSSSSSTSPSRSRSRFRSLPCLSSLHSQTLCVRARGVAMLNQQLQPVPCLRNSAPSLWFRQSRVMPSSRESAAGSGGSSGCGN